MMLPTLEVPSLGLRSARRRSLPSQWEREGSLVAVQWICVFEMLDASEAGVVIRARLVDEEARRFLVVQVEVLVGRQVRDRNDVLRVPFPALPIDVRGPVARDDEVRLVAHVAVLAR